MDNVIKVDFQGKKVEAADAQPKSYQRLERSNVLVVDFKTRKLVENIKTEELVTMDFDLTHFETPPSDSNFAIFTDEERFEHSEHILEFFHQMDLCDILHFVKMGVLDKQKLAAKLSIPYCHAG